MSERLTRRDALGALALPFLAPVRGAPGPRPLRHFYWVNGTSPVALLARRKGLVDLVSPQWFHVQASGSLRSELDLELLAAAAELGIPLLPVVVNEGFRGDVARDVLGRESAWRPLADELAAVALAYGLRGLQVDFEELPAESGEAYPRFVALLAGVLRRSGLLCSVAVGAPLAAAPDAAGRWPDGPHAAALDYAALGRAADSITVMTYDQHAAPRNPGPVAGRPWVEACVRSLLAVVPAPRLLLGMPLYHRRWSDGLVVEGSHADALDLAARAGVTVRLDREQEEKTFQFVADGATNVVWLHDRQTLRQRIALAERFGLGGFSAWRLGHEDQAFWRWGGRLDGSTPQRTKRTSQR